MIIVVGALIVQGGKFLLAERSHGELKGKWEFPGGKLEKGETEEEALVREIEEELGVQVVIEEKIKVFTHKYSFGDIHLTLLRCNLSDDVQHIGLRGSHEKFDWVDYNTRDINFAPLDRKIFTYLKKHYVI